MIWSNDILAKDISEFRYQGKLREWCKWIVQTFYDIHAKNIAQGGYLRDLYTSEYLQAPFYIFLPIPSSA